MHAKQLMRAGVPAVCVAMGLALSSGPVTSAVPTPTQRVRADEPVISAAEFAEPDNQFRPATRWWWQAPLSRDESIREVNAIADAGFGEVEIAFSEGAWDTQDQRDNLQAVLEEADDLGVEVSMTMGAAWPVQTPNTGEGSGYAAQELQYGRVDVRGGRRYSGPVPEAFDKELFGQPADLVAVTAARVVRRGPKAELLPEDERPQWGSPVRVPSSSTVLDPASLVDLTDRAKDGRITWRAPKGDWIVFGFWARENEEHNTNPFDADAARAATEYLDTGQIGDENAALLRDVGGDFFEDSLELNANSIFWTPKMGAIFKQRRGYAMSKYLPLMFAHGMSNYWVPNSEPTPDFELPDREGTKVRSDYYRLLTDLYVDEHLSVFQDWAADYGMQFKTQAAYGQDLEPVRSYRELARMGGQPETESLNAGDRVPTDIDNTNWRFALDHHRNSAAGVQQAGKTSLSTELGAVFDYAYRVHLGDYREMMDKEWSAGVTKPFIHGYAYQSTDATWPGKQRFGEFVSDSWNDQTFPQWAMWSDLNDYWARGTQILETGTAKADVAIYRDGFLTTTARGFNPPMDHTAPKRLFDTKALEKSGYITQYVDPVGLAEKGVVGNGTLFPDTVGYRGLIVDERAISADAARAVAKAARRGLAIVFVGSTPTEDTTYASGRAGDRAVRKAVDIALRQPSATRVDTQADAARALARLGVRPRADWNDEHVLAQWREAGDTRYVYLYNPTDDRIDFKPSFKGAGDPATMNLWDGTIDPIAQYRTRGGRTTVPTSLRSHEATVIAIDSAVHPRVHVTNKADDDLVTDDGRIVLRTREDGRRTFRLSNGSRRTVIARVPDEPAASVGPDTWSLGVTAETPSGDKEVSVDSLAELADWRTIAGLEGESGVGTYTGTIDVPADWLADGAGVEVALGRVDGTAEVRVNGEGVGEQVVSGGSFDISDALRRGENTVEVVVRTTLRNAVTTYNEQSTKSQPYGLRGPVKIRPYAQVLVYDPKA